MCDAMPSESAIRKVYAVRSQFQNTTNPEEVVEKVLYLRRKYHLGPVRTTWYMARYHAIRMSAAIIYRILKRNGLNCLPRHQCTTK